MPVKTLTYLLSRFFALYLLMQLISYSVIFIPQLILRPAFGEVWFICTVPVLFLVAILFFWIKAEWVAGKISGKFAGNEIRTALSVEGLQNTGFAFMGMFFLAQAMPLLIKIAVTLASPRAYNYNPWPASIEAGLEIVIGLLLIFGAQGLGRIISKLRGK